jgi:hypothetical protein
VEHEPGNNAFTALRNLALRREGERHRSSSYDRSGGNDDFIRLNPGQSLCLADIRGAGCITHIWMAGGEVPHTRRQLFLRKTVLRMFWDGEREASVQVPLGDFFGMGHAETRNFTCAPFSMSPQDGKGLNCFLSMPFSEGARVELTNEHDKTIRIYYYIDYEHYEHLSGHYLRLHACWRRTNPCLGVSEAGMSNEAFQYSGTNTTGAGNFVILDAEGDGHYVGCHLDIHNLRLTRQWNWYGEGDDMIFIDGDTWPPRLHGTGTEDYFNTAWCPTQEMCTPYHGVIMAGGPNFSGRITLYRYHIEDPVIFHRSIRVTIEHGHNNHRSDDYTSTAYWYQAEPHKLLPSLPPVEQRLPLPEVIPDNQEEVLKYVDCAEKSRS